MKPIEARLHASVRRSFEIELAGLECLALGYEGVHYDWRTRTFTMRGSDEWPLLTRSSWFGAVRPGGGGEWGRTLVSDLMDAMEGIAEIRDNWGVYMIYTSFRGKMPPRTARSANNIALPEGSGVILDPFAGSGTTGTEAAMLELPSRLVEIEHFFVRIIEARVRALFGELWGVEEPQEFLEAVRSAGIVTREVLDGFHPAMEVLWEWAWFKVKKLAKKNRRAAENKRVSVFLDRAAKAREAVLAVREVLEKWGIRLAPIEYGVGDATRLDGIPSDSVDGIVTSPPYLTAVDYQKENQIPEGWAKADPARRVDGRGEEHYAESMARAVDQMTRVARPGARAVVVIGTTKKKGKFNAVDLIRRLMVESGWIPLRRPDGTPWEIEQFIAAAKTIKSDRILLFELS